MVICRIQGEETTIDPQMFEYIKRTLTAGVVESLMDNRGWSEDEAIRSFLNSEVYDRLSKENTKVWHFSVKALSELYEDELNGSLEWPVEP